MVVFIVLATSSGEGTHHIYVQLAQVSRHSHVPSLHPCPRLSHIWKSHFQVSETRMHLDMVLQILLLLQGISKSSCISARRCSGAFLPAGPLGAAHPRSGDSQPGRGSMLLAQCAA